MIRLVLKRYTLASIFPINLFTHNSDTPIITGETDPQSPIVQGETGWDRVTQMYMKDDFGRLSSELQTVIQVSCTSSIIGFLYGGVIYSRDAYLDFIRRNQATAFDSHFEAKRKLQDAVSLGFIKGAFRWGWRLTLFTTMYITASTMVTAYRDKNGILEHTVGGVLAGALYKFKLGPRGWLVGAGVGCALGTLAGLLTHSLLTMAGLSMKEVRYWNYRWVEKRTQAYNAKVQKQVNNEADQLLLEYDAKVKNSNIDVLDTVAITSSNNNN